MKLSVPIDPVLVVDTVSMLQRTIQAPPLGPSYSWPSPEGQLDALVQPPRFSRSLVERSTGDAEAMEEKTKAATVRLLRMKGYMSSVLCR